MRIALFVTCVGDTNVTDGEASAWNDTVAPGTKSVLKRPAIDESVTVQAGYEGALVPVPSDKIVDPAVRQAGVLPVPRELDAWR